MTTAGLEDLARLRALLHAVPPPGDHLEALTAARRAAAGADGLGRDVLLAEARWLCEQARGQAPLQAAAAAAGAALRQLRARCLERAPATDVESLFDLAELHGECAAAGERALAAALAERIAARARLQRDVARLRQEADERWAAQTAADDQQPLREQVEVLRATGALLLRAAAATGDAKLRRRGRRSLRAAWDRELLARLERLLGRRGVVALETTSIALLLLVLGVIALESLVPLGAGQERLLQWVDAGACSCFIAEFLLKFALAPHRGGWFLRNAVTDLLPAIPAALFLLPGPGAPGFAGEAVSLRLLRFLRITWLSRYVQALRPLLRLLRLLLLMVRGMDGVVRRFAGLLDRNFVFFEPPPPGPVGGGDRRELVFAALEREQALLGLLAPAGRRAALERRLAAVASAAAALPACWSPPPEPLGPRDIAVDEASEFLWSLQPAEVGRYLAPGDLRALDRAVRVLHALPIGWLPFVRRFRIAPLPATPEARIAALAHRVADWLQGWQGRLQFLADLHGIVTGPQILDRVATAMIRSSQRPAVRLLLFGGLFMLFDLLVKSPGISAFFQRIVVGPLLVLGSFCLVVLTLGWWLKRVAGEASESFRLTSEANYLSLLELLKQRTEDADLAWLASRVFAARLPPDRAAALLRQQLAAVRSGAAAPAAERPDLVQEAHRAALLYLHFLDGAILHETDDKTTQQLLANLSLENLRHGWLGVTRQDRRRLRALRLEDGSVLRGPFLWFRFITESIAVETAKRITEYNRRCAPCEERARWPAAQERELRAWLDRRRDPKAGRTLERLPPPGEGTAFLTTEFNAFDFLAADPARDRHVASMFGDDVLAALRADRRNMIREIFGMRPVHALPRGARSWNAYRFYWARLSHGRAFLLPLLAAARLLRTCGWCVGRIRQVTREVLSPHLAMQQRERGEAPFAVALRKIHRMKAPGLLEGIGVRVLVDPAYGGAPAGWSAAGATPRVPALERDLDFLRLRERERAEFRAIAAQNRAHVSVLHALLDSLPDLAGPSVPAADGELAVTVAWMTDRARVRTLLRAEAWRTETFPELASRRPDVPLLRRLCARVADLFAVHPADAFLQRHCGRVPSRLRVNLRALYRADAGARAIVDAWRALPAGSGPAAVAIDRLRAIWRDAHGVRREILALRTVQSLTVLDVRNYRELVFRLGCYEADGDDPAAAAGLP